MNIRRTNIILIVIAFLVMGTACTVQEAPIETATSTLEQGGSQAQEDESLHTSEDESSSATEEPSSMEEEEVVLTPEDELSSTSEEEPALILEDELLSENKKESEPTVSINDKYDEYFSNSVFVGDSVMEGFAQYIRAQRNNGASMLSNAQFLTSIMGIKVADIVGDTAEEHRIYYTYRGKDQPLEITLKEMGAERIFIMMGMNDLGLGLSPGETVERYHKMILLIKETNPDLDVVVMTTTPKTATKWLPNYIQNKDFGSPLINEFAGMLRVMCEEEGIKVVDVNAAVRGEDGHLPDDYSRDNFVHINDKCSAVVLDTLRQFAKIQMEE